MESVLVRWVVAVAVVAAMSYGKTVKMGSGIVYENCGPPFNLTISPNPPKIRQAVNITLEIVAAHDLIAGVIEAYANVWPYHYKDVYCADGVTIDPKGCYISKGERRVISTSIWIDDNVKEMHYRANATLRNEYDELLICVRAWADL